METKLVSHLDKGIHKLNPVENGVNGKKPGMDLIGL
jgi:hypothetical protein